jgi:surface protein
MGYVINPYTYAATGETKFVMEIELTDPADLTFMWYTAGTGALSPLYTIDWGDGNIDVDSTISITHTYATTGTYDIKVSGKSYVKPANHSPNRSKIKNLKNWGTSDFEVTYMGSAFLGCSNMEYTATDYPNLSSSFSSDIASMFYLCSSITSLDLSNWQNTDRITGNCGNAFHTTSNCTLYDLTGWDVSNITNASNWFLYAGYNTGIGGTEIKMPDMNWASATNFATMFMRANAVVDLSNWTFPNSGNNAFNSTFYFAGYGATREFRTAGVGNKLDLSTWNNTNWINSLINTWGYFQNSTEINLTGWDFTNVKTWSGAFNQCTNLEEIPGMANFRIASGGTAQVGNMFNGCKKIDFTNHNLSAQFITDFNTYVTNSSGMFVNVGALNSVAKLGPNIVGMNLCANNSTTISSMFQSMKTSNDYTPIYNALPVNGATAIQFTSAFYISSNHTSTGALDLSSWTCVFGTNMTNAFRTAIWSTIDFGDNIDFSNVELMAYTFFGNNNLTSITWPTGLDLSSLTNGTSMLPGNRYMGKTNYDHFLDRMAITWNTALTAGTLTFGITQYTKSVLTTGTATSTTANKLVDSTKDFSASGLNVQVNDIVFDDTGNAYAKITAVDNATTLSLNADVIVSWRCL